MHKSPLIISGIGRSGTSAVISSMSKHKLVVEPKRVGEAPFINHFIKFLIEYEDNSPHRDYHLKNYQLDAGGRDEVFSNLLSQIQYGFDVDAIDPQKKYWIAKVSLNSDSYKKACEMFSDLKLIYVVRNGVEVVNSAKSFVGFKDLTFEQLCKRWATNLEECRYVHNSENCAVVRHDELVVDPAGVYARVYDRLVLEHDNAPAEFISSTLFNSSFDKSAKMDSTSKVFENRLECWNEWSKEQKSTFIDICDPYMEEYEFARPYCADETFRSEVISPVSTCSPVLVAENNEVADEIKQLVSPHMSVPQFNYHANPSPRYGYLFIENPKVASTTTLKILQAMEDPDVAASMKNSHQRDASPIPRISRLADEEQLKYIESEEVFRFTFVRNPYSRLLSAYLSKIDRPLRPKAEILAALKGVTKHDIDDLNEKVKFTDFVDVVCSQSVRQMNVHWKNQVDQTFFEKLNYSFVGKFENLQSDLAKVEKKLFGSASDSLQKSTNMTEADARMAKFYTPEIAEKVYQKFYDDFQAFGYDRAMSVSAAA